MKLLLFLIVAVVVVLVLHRQLRRKAASAPAPPLALPVDGATSYLWDASGYFAQELNADEVDADALRRAALPHGPEGVSMAFTAFLRPVGPDGDGAVLVARGTQVLARLSADRSQRFLLLLAKRGLAEQTTRCAACITGGAVERSGSRRPYALSLDIAPLAS